MRFFDLLGEFTVNAIKKGGEKTKEYFNNTLELKKEYYAMSQDELINMYKIAKKKNDVSARTAIRMVLKEKYNYTDEELNFIL